MARAMQPGLFGSNLSDFIPRSQPRFAARCGSLLSEGKRQLARAAFPIPSPPRGSPSPPSANLEG